HDGDTALLSAYEDEERHKEGSIWPVIACRACRQIDWPPNAVDRGIVPRFEEMRIARVMGPLWVEARKLTGDAWSEKEIGDLADAFMFASPDVGAVQDYMNDCNFSIAHRFGVELYEPLRAAERTLWKTDT
ncbi:MAG: hypothetical protein ACYDA1_04330, partial [Vulcanimicrobiaceae bacterium]